MIAKKKYQVEFFVGNENVVELLIRNGANINSTNFDGKTALHHAAAFGNSNCQQRIIGF